MNLKRSVWVLGFLCALAPAQSGLRADDRPTLVPRSLDLQDVKVQWFSHDSEELPAWISAHFEVGPMDRVSGTVTETDLAADGVDEDGDPIGFETSVFDTAEGSLTGISLGPDGFTFTTVLTGQDSERVTYAMHRSATVQGAWTLTAAGKSSKGLSFGHNRFPLAGDEKQRGTLKITTAQDAAGDPLPSL